jgi:putative SOS response-associated peptidase YedK
MSRLHCFMATAAEIAAPFGATYPQDLMVPQQTFEGLPGLVVFEADRRMLRSMRWGFPRLARGGRVPEEGPDKIGLVADLTNPMWAHMVVEPRYRCPIPITHFANPDGDEGKTRTWFSVKGQPIAAWAGFCRNTEAFGPVYAGVTMDANAAVMPTNDRMPVLLEPHEFDQWLHGSIKDVIGFQFRAPIAADRMEVDQTGERWRSEGFPSTARQPAFL